MKRSIQYIQTGAGPNGEAYAIVNRGTYESATNKLKIYSLITLTSLRRAQRAQLVLAAKGESA